MKVLKTVPVISWGASHPVLTGTENQSQDFAHKLAQFVGLGSAALLPAAKFDDFLWQTENTIPTAPVVPSFRLGRREGRAMFGSIPNLRRFHLLQP